MSNDDVPIPEMPEALSPIGPEIARDPNPREDDWEQFKREAKNRYPGADISGVDPDEIRRWIDDIRRKAKRG